MALLTIDQEIGELLANNLTADEEDAVQDELTRLQAELVRLDHSGFQPQLLNLLQMQEEPATAVELPSVPTHEPITAETTPAAQEQEQARERVALAA
jgi:charged multivesicular body protein 6